MALLKDQKGEVIKKFRNELPLNVPSAKMQALKASHFIYTDYFDIAPGKYEVEAAVLDSEGANRISTRKSSLVVPALSAGLSISSVSFVRDMKNTEPSAADTDPLLFNGKVVSPSLRPVVAKGGNSNLPFYLVAYADKSVAAAPKLTMEFSKNGQVLGQVAPEIGQPDKAGRIHYLGTIPAASLDSGDYTIRFLLQQGTETAEEAAFFAVQ